jgi:eukaryotic-like serine/threonine-protein kinase
MAPSAPIVIGQYALFDELAAGGMATVHLGRLLGPVGFGRTVAVKRLHSHFLKDEEFITMFMDEARIVARIRHPNVVPMVDVVEADKGLFLVMEYVHGESLSRLMRTARKNEEQIPPRIVAAIMCGVLLGLHAAHDTKAADGTLLGVVHRDVSPQNIIVGVDGVARVLDFGIAKAAGRSQVTREGQIKGKLAYMAPEQIRGQVDRRTDVFAASVVVWEMLAGRRLHEGSKDVDIVTRVVKGNFPPPSDAVPSLGPELDAIVMRGLATDPKQRFASARDLAIELERKVGLASPSEVSAWVERLATEVLFARASLVSAMELAANDLIASAPIPPAPPAPAFGFPSSGHIPVHIDEVPSSSAVFAHTQTPHDLRPTAVQPRRKDAIAWLVVAVSLLLAIIGVGLGSYALLHRAARLRSPHTDPAATPNGMVSSPDTVPPSSEMEEPPTVVPLASAQSPTPGATTSPARTPAPPAAPMIRVQPKAKANCDPPYTVDDVGHRHYKPECD